LKQPSYDISPLIDDNRLCSEVCDDMTIMVAGQGGDGSLTIIALVSRAYRVRYWISVTTSIEPTILRRESRAVMPQP